MNRLYLGTLLIAELLKEMRKAGLTEKEMAGLLRQQAN